MKHIYYKDQDGKELINLSGRFRLFLLFLLILGVAVFFIFFKLNNKDTKYDIAIGQYLPPLEKGCNNMGSTNLDSVGSYDNIAVVDSDKHLFLCNLLIDNIFNLNSNKLNNRRATINQRANKLLTSFIEHSLREKQNVNAGSQQSLPSAQKLLRIGRHGFFVFEVAVDSKQVKKMLAEELGANSGNNEQPKNRLGLVVDVYKNASDILAQFMFMVDPSEPLSSRIYFYWQDGLIIKNENTTVNNYKEFATWLDKTSQRISGKINKIAKCRSYVFYLDKCYLLDNSDEDQAERILPISHQLLQDLKSGAAAYANASDNKKNQKGAKRQKPEPLGILLSDLTTKQFNWGELMLAKSKGKKSVNPALNNNEFFLSKIKAKDAFLYKALPSKYRRQISSYFTVKDDQGSLIGFDPYLSNGTLNFGVLELRNINSADNIVAMSDVIKEGIAHQKMRDLFDEKLLLFAIRIISLDRDMDINIKPYGGLASQYVKIKLVENISQSFFITD